MNKALEKPLPKNKAWYQKSMYYILVEEWLYPTESGRDVHDDYASYQAALLKASEFCEDEMYNFAHETGCDPTRPKAFINNDGTKQGVCITCLNGIDEWWYAVKIIPVEHGLT